MEYDEHTRINKIAGPYDSLSDPTISFEYNPEFVVGSTPPPHAITYHKDKANNPIETVLFIDSLKRAVQTKKDAVINCSNKVNKKYSKLAFLSKSY